MPQEVEHHHADAQVPPGAFGNHRLIHAHAVVNDQRLQVIPQGLVKLAVVNDQVGFKVKRQAQRIEVAGAYGDPVIVHQRDFAVQRPTAVFVDLDAALHQVVVQQPRPDFDDRHIRLALDNQLHAHAASCSISHGMQQSIAREKVGVSDYHFALGVGQHLEIVTFNVVPVLAVVAPDEKRLRFAGLPVLFRAMAASPPAAYGLFPRQVLQLKQQDVLHHRAFNANGVILLRFRAVVGHMFRRVVNAADKRYRLIHHHNFAVHPAEKVGPHAEQARAGIVVAEYHACGGQFIDERIAEVRRAVAIQQYFNFDAALCGAQEHAMQLLADVVFEPDKGFEDHFLLGVINCLKHGRVILVPVDQQRNPVAFLPGTFHKWISALSGAWSERCRQLRSARAVGLLAWAFFT